MEHPELQFIKNLVGTAGQFLGSGCELSLDSFGTWLTQQQKVNKQVQNVQVTDNTEHNRDSEITMYLIFMQRYAKTYAKKLLANSAITSLDEFVFLISLFKHGKHTKTELIDLSRLEKPTGMEIIRRLLKAELIVQADHETDKRSKQLCITDAGKQALFLILDHMDEFAALVTGNLADTDKNDLLRMLKQLEAFHEPLRQHAKSASEWAVFYTKTGLKST
jgi:MarR family transcriptional regulator, lower aerobic nicotinate degradation pathway regulator